MRACGAAISSPPSTARASTIPRVSAIGWRRNRSAAPPSLTYLRNGKPSTASVKLIPAPEIPARDPVKLKGASPFSGATVINLSPAVLEELSIRGVSDGVVISEVEEGSRAALVNFQIGDVIVSINDEPIKTTRDLEQAVSRYHNYWKLTIGRGGEVITTVIGG